MRAVGRGPGAAAGPSVVDPAPPQGSPCGVALAAEASYGRGMDPTAMTFVSQLITDARSRFGTAEVEAVAVERSLLDEAMDHVLALGGEVTEDGCVVDGVRIRELPPGAEAPLVELRSASEPRPLLSDEQA